MKVLKIVCTLTVTLIIDICMTSVMLWLTCIVLNISLTNLQFIMLSIIVTLWSIKIDIKILKDIDN